MDINAEKVVYLAGGITGTTNYKEHFDSGEKLLREKGYVVLNPTCLPTDLPYESYFPINFAMIEVSDIVVFLSGWEKSRGAVLERERCIALGKQTKSEEWIIWAPKIDRHGGIT